MALYLSPLVDINEVDISTTIPSVATSIGVLEAPKIDGILTDKSWNLVKWSGNYIQWSPKENTQPTEQTQLKILYDDKNLYVAFRCYDKDPQGCLPP